METESKWRMVACLLGLGAYWAWTLLDRSGLVLPGGFGAGIDPSIQTGITLVVAAGLVWVSYGLKTVARWKVMRLAIAAVAVFACLSFAAAALFPEAVGIRFVAAGPLAVLRSGLMIFWTTWVVSQGRTSMVKTMIVGSCVAMVMYLVVSGVPQLVSQVLFYALVFVSGCSMVAMRFDISWAKPGDSATGALSGFSAVRFLLGFLIGLVASVTVSAEIARMNEWQMIVSLALCFVPVAFAIVILKTDSNLTVLTVLCPLALSACFILPAALQPSMLLNVSVSLIWFCTIFVSMAHICFSKGLRGWPLVLLVAWAQLLSSVGTFFGNSLASVPFFDAVYEIPILFRVVFSLLIFYVLLLVSVYFLSRLVARRQGGEARTETQSAVACLARRYGLTRREEEVLGLLAAGYSRPYIGERLVLSTSTVKTHVNHVYQKIGIGKHDDLLDLIEGEKAKLREG